MSSAGAKPKLLILLVVVPLLLVAAGLVLRHLTRPASGQASTPPGELPKVTITESGTPAQPPGAPGEKPKLSVDPDGRTADGVKIILPYDATDRTPRLEFAFVEIDEDGNAHPYRVKTLEVVRVDETWLANYYVEGTGLRLAVGTKQDVRQLVPGVRYYVRGQPERCEFSLPAVKEGQTANLQLVLSDKRKQRTAAPSPQPAHRNSRGGDAP